MYGGGGNPGGAGSSNMGGGSIADHPGAEDLNIRKADSIKFDSLLGGPDPAELRRRRRH